MTPAKTGFQLPSTPSLRHNALYYIEPEWDRIGRYTMPLGGGIVMNPNRALPEKGDITEIAASPGPCGSWQVSSAGGHFLS
jgi:hypothetical protein